MLHAPDNRNFVLRIQLNHLLLGKIVDINSCWLSRNYRLFHRRRFNPFPPTCISDNLRKLSSRRMRRRAFPRRLNRRRKRSTLHRIKSWWNQWIPGIDSCRGNCDPKHQNARTESKEPDLHPLLQAPAHSSYRAHPNSASYRSHCSSIPLILNISIRYLKEFGIRLSQLNLLNIHLRFKTIPRFISFAHDIESQHWRVPVLNAPPLRGRLDIPHSLQSLHL